jgi:hypothetical protein
VLPEHAVHASPRRPHALAVVLVTQVPVLSQQPPQFAGLQLP